MRVIHAVTFCAGLVLPNVLAAQANDRLQPDFTFRMIGAPSAGSPGRITVQIDPTAPSAIRAPDSAFEDAEGSDAPVQVAAAAAAAPDASAAAPSPSGFEWFWASISPKREDSRPGRLADAVSVLTDPAAGGSAPMPRMQSLQDIAQAHGADILRATIGTEVSPALVLAVISVESAGRAEAVSSAGASGLMQLMPATAERFGVTDRTSPAQNIEGGVAYLNWLLDHFDGDPILALAGYNAGEGAVRDNGGVPPYPETRGYVPKVLAAWTVARGLCLTPPELISDGCVFAIGNL